MKITHAKEKNFDHSGWEFVGCSESCDPINVAHHTVLCTFDLIESGHTEILILDCGDNFEFYCPKHTE